MSFTHYQFITNRTCEKPHKKFANMPAKPKCYTDRSTSVEHHEDTSEVEPLKVTHPVSSITSIHILSITITTLAAKESVVITFFVILGLD